MQHRPTEPATGARYRGKQHHHPQRYAGHQRDQRATDHDEQRRTQIRLYGSQAHRHQDQGGHYGQRTQAQRQRPVLQVPGAQQGYGKLHDFGRLKTYEAQVEPALRTLTDITGGIDHQQQHDTQCIKPRRNGTQCVGPNLCQRHHGRTA